MEKMGMNLKLIATLICYLIPPEDATPLAALRLSSTTVFGENGCPVSSKRISPEINNSPFIIGSDSVDDSGNKKEKIIVAPISRKLFNKLELVILPTREVCVLGEKLENLRVPYRSKFEEFRIMTGIAIWFSPCVSRPSHTECMKCLDKRMKSINSVDISVFKSLHDFMVAAFEDM